MCSCAANSVVISDRDSAIVARMSLEDGRLLWSFTSIERPDGICYHPAGYVFVVRCKLDHTEISLLDEEDGSILLCVNNNH